MTGSVDDFMASLSGRTSGTGEHVVPGVGVTDGQNDAAHAAQMLKDAYRRRIGRDMPAYFVKQIEGMLRQVYGMPPKDPAYGPGHWSDMAKRTADDMVMARPIDLLGAPDRMDVDLMYLHAIRMGEFLCRLSRDWAETLPSCWIRHDGVVLEVFALACDLDAISNGDLGGLYMPGWLQSVQQSLERIRLILAKDRSSIPHHAHHMTDRQSEERRAARLAEYENWNRNRGEWAEPYDRKDPLWQGESPDWARTVLTRYGWPFDASAPETGTDESLSAAARAARRRLDGYESRMSEEGSDEVEDAARAELGRLRPTVDSWRDAESKARDDLDRECAAARSRLSDADRPLKGDAETHARAVLAAAQALLESGGDCGRVRVGRPYRPLPVDTVHEMTRMVRAVAEDDADAVAKLALLTDEAVGLTETIGAEPRHRLRVLVDRARERLRERRPSPAGLEQAVNAATDALAQGVAPDSKDGLATADELDVLSGRLETMLNDREGRDAGDAS